MDNKTKFPNFEEKFSSLSAVHKKLFLFYSLNWKKKTCSWDFGLYKKIKKLTITEAERLYNYICKEIEFNNFDELEKKINNFFGNTCKEYLQVFLLLSRKVLIAVTYESTYLESKKSLREILFL